LPVCHDFKAACTQLTRQAGLAGRSQHPRALYQSFDRHCKVSRKLLRTFVATNENLVGRSSTRTPSAEHQRNYFATCVASYGGFFIAMVHADGSRFPWGMTRGKNNVKDCAPRGRGLLRLVLFTLFICSWMRTKDRKRSRSMSYCLRDVTAFRSLRCSCPVCCGFLHVRCAGVGAQLVPRRGCG
jgi:hypothetical protein